MEPLPPSRWSKLVETDSAVDGSTLRHLTSPEAGCDLQAGLNRLRKSGRRLHDQQLTQALLTDLSEVAQIRLGEDPLSQFDTPVAFVSGGLPRIYCMTESTTIVISEGPIQAIEMMAAHAALVNLLRRLRENLRDDTADLNALREQLKKSHGVVYGLIQARLLLHLMGEREAPRLANLLPREYMSFVHQQTALCIVFALLHEQAHIEFAKQRASGSSAAFQTTTAKAPIKESVVIEAINGDKEEEFSADNWAILQAKEGRHTLIKAATFFFLNQWVFDVIAHRNDGQHPAAFNRIVALSEAFPEFGRADPGFHNVVRSGLFGQNSFRRTMSETTPGKRYAGMLKYARALSDFSSLKDLITALSGSYRQAFPL